MENPKKTMKRKGPPKLFKMVMFALVVAAVTKELQKDPENREWHGSLGFIPYEFRVPTIERIKERVWDPEGEHIFSPHVFGVGWTLNVGRVVALAKEQIAD